MYNYNEPTVFTRVKASWNSHLFAVYLAAFFTKILGGITGWRPLITYIPPLHKLIQNKILFNQVIVTFQDEHSLNRKRRGDSFL